MDLALKVSTICNPGPGNYSTSGTEPETDLLLNPHQATLDEALAPERLERAIGVICRPETKRHGHYFLSNLARRFDAVIHCDHTHAFRPPESTPDREVSAPEEETYPTGL